MSQIFLKDLTEMSYSDFDPDNDIILMQKAFSSANQNPTAFRTNSFQIQELTSTSGASITFLPAAQEIYSLDASGKSLNGARQTITNLDTYGIPNSANMVLLNLVDSIQGGGTRQRALHVKFFKNSPPTDEGRFDYYRSYHSKYYKDGRTQPIMNTDQVWVPIVDGANGKEFTFIAATLVNSKLKISILAYS